MPSTAIELLKKYDSLLPDLSLNTHSKQLHSALQELSNYKFRIVILGEFNAGKSSVINALLGQKILPVGLKPTTVQITEISRSSGPGSLRTEPQNASQHAPSLESLKLIANDPQIKRIFLQVAAETSPDLSESVIIDTPGTNDPFDWGKDIVFQELEEADIVLFLFSSLQAYTQTERTFLTRVVTKSNQDKIFFVVNKADLCHDLREVLQQVNTDLATDFQLNNLEARGRIFPLSANLALEAKLANDRDALIDSGYTKLVNAITTFMAANTGRLLEDAARNRISVTLNHIRLAAATLLEHESQDAPSKLEKDIDTLNTQLTDLKVMCAQEKADLLRDVDSAKRHCRSRINHAVQSILTKCDLLISGSTDLSRDARRIEMEATKLLRDEFAVIFEEFSAQLAESFGKFEGKVETAAKRLHITLPPPANSKILGTTVKVGATAAAVAGAVTYGPALMIGGGVVGLTSVVAPFLMPMIAATGPLAAIAVAGLGSLAVVASGVLGSVVTGAKSVTSLVFTALDKVDRSLDKLKYKRSLAKQLEQTGKNLTEQLDALTEKDISTAIDSLLESKFPQRTILQQHKEGLLQRMSDDAATRARRIQSLHAFLAEIDIAMQSI